MFGGDTMLGRIVKKYMLRYGSNYPLGPIAPLMRNADLTIVNLECAITSTVGLWPGEPKAFYFGAAPQAVHTLTDAGVDMVNLANNHMLDFDVEGLRQTLHYLKKHGIGFTGAGENLIEANTPAIIERQGVRFGMTAFCDHQEDFAAGEHRPGIAYINLDDEAGALASFRQALESPRMAGVDWPILSLHWGPNMVFRPSIKFRRLAHAAIDMGWKILFGHSAHVFQGIEIYHGCPILYAAGDLVDDYYVDPGFRNDHQLLIEIEFDRTAMRHIQLHPVFIEHCQARPATGEQLDYIVDQMTVLCRELGSELSSSDLSIHLAS